MARREIACTVTGRVQMVMYRDFVARGARSLGVCGFVRNEPDGSVRVVAEGEEAALIALIDRLKKGSLFSRVEKVDVKWREPTGRYDDFRIIY